mmetsp:Transcript_27248/g.38025  ORF Transcript_27248/g.38025 Transcript_27248/m.38025 type:complete len:230 (+) Transcript_27248:155-844(+)|eukprot:CAMPEP_0185265172 /NCGR_PEP_ID=MMETSP1359-20130426/26691_1 /TAXON_ID=552665 /ORGANISM="Bigelowiella longifila, Strain CCMP242" /LENGTH=229 /DNA_ID=CAMNT_0027854291 /DNA_START=108 /DNA_END=797 /DNA_ORIENTATION=-
MRIGASVLARKLSTYTSTRNRSIDPRKTALLIIDVQNLTFNDNERRRRPWFWNRAESVVIPNIAHMQRECRRTGVEVMFTVIENLTLDGRDRSLDYKISGFNVPRGSWEAQVIAPIKPSVDEIVLPKTSSGVFNSTMIEYVLRNIGIETILVTGFLTDQCIDMAIRDGADKGFYMECIEDACATESQERHTNALSAFSGYCRTRTTGEVLSELGSKPSQPRVAKNVEEM